MSQLISNLANTYMIKPNWKYKCWPYFSQKLVKLKNMDIIFMKSSISVDTHIPEWTLILVDAHTYTNYPNEHLQKTKLEC